MTREYREYAKSRIEYLLKICRLDERDKEALEAAIKALSQVSEIEENIINYMKKYPNHVGNTDFWEGFYACRNVVLQLDDEEYAPKEQEPTIRDVVGYEGICTVDIFGNVFNADGKLMKQRTNEWGYFDIGLSKNILNILLLQNQEKQK